MESNNGR